MVISIWLVSLTKDLSVFRLRLNSQPLSRRPLEPKSSDYCNNSCFTSWICIAFDMSRETCLDTFFATAAVTASVVVDIIVIGRLLSRKAEGAAQIEQHGLNNVVFLWGTAYSFYLMWKDELGYYFGLADAPPCLFRDLVFMRNDKGKKPIVPSNGSGSRGIMGRVAAATSIETKAIKTEHPELIFKEGWAFRGSRISETSGGY